MLDGDGPNGTRFACTSAERSRTIPMQAGNESHAHNGAHGFFKVIGAWQRALRYNSHAAKPGIAPARWAGGELI